MPDVKVRIGVPEDLDAAMDLAMRCVSEIGLTNPNPEKLLREVWDGLHQNNAIAGVIGGHDLLEGAILLRIEPLWYSDEKSIVERAAMVRPEYRPKSKGDHAKLLCEFAKKVSGRLDIPLVIGVLNSRRTAGKIRLYERQFGPMSGACWIYGRKTGFQNFEENA